MLPRLVRVFRRKKNSLANEKGYSIAPFAPATIPTSLIPSHQSSVFLKRPDDSDHASPDFLTVPYMHMGDQYVCRMLQRHKTPAMGDPARQAQQSALDPVRGCRGSHGNVCARATPRTCARGNRQHSANEQKQKTKNKADSQQAKGKPTRGEGEAQGRTLP